MLKACSVLCIANLPAVQAPLKLRVYECFIIIIITSYSLFVIRFYIQDYLSVYFC